MDKLEDGVSATTSTLDNSHDTENIFVLVIRSSQTEGSVRVPFRIDCSAFGRGLKKMKRLYQCISIRSKGGTQRT